MITESNQIPFFDTHCHLNSEPLASNTRAVLHRARNKGVGALVIPGATREDSVLALEIAATLGSRSPDGPDSPNTPETGISTNTGSVIEHNRPKLKVLAGVGLHPISLHVDTQTNRDNLQALEELVTTSPHRDLICAIGEIGVDTMANPQVPREQQNRIFMEQMNLARRLNLPAIIHCRSHYGNLLNLLKGLAENIGGTESSTAAGSLPLPLPGVVHSFNGSYEMGMELIGLGYLIGVGPVVTRPKATRVRQAIARLPLEGMVLETDAPFIGTATTPKGLVEPAHLPEVAAALAQLKGVPVNQVATVTLANSLRLFQLENL